MTDAEMVAWLETQYDLNENGCWVWKRIKTSDGYGKVKWKGTMKIVHRVYWLLSGRTISEGLEMCHGPCHNRACFNPEHLRPGTRTENEADRVRDGTDARGEKNVNAKLTAKQVLAIRASEKSQKELAEEYGVHNATISRIILRKDWKHIT
tara:strand:- start:268 stop:720 length:453 start_codon:yes stop_codon:yes gene_type:complete